MSTPLAITPRSDWYQATIEAQPHELIETLRVAVDGTVRESRGRQGYRQLFEVVSGGSVWASVLCGGKNGHPNSWASGQDSEAFMRIVRENWPEHRVSRMDSALDFDEPGAWSRITGLALAIADDLHIAVEHAGDWHRGEKGRTIYVGSRKSAVFVRIYEKGKQLPEEGRPNWVRVEVQVRPDGPARSRAASADAVGMWGFARFTKRMAFELAGLDMERVAISVRRPADRDRALRAMVGQYWRSLEEQAADEGGWAELGVYLGKLFREEARKP